MDDVKKVVMYGTKHCSYCGAAQMLLTKKGVDYEFILVSDARLRDEIERRSGQRTVPQIFIDDEPVGGFDELYALDQDGRLDALLAGA
jgi:glutaredoxin 3